MNRPSLSWFIGSRNGKHSLVRAVTVAAFNLPEAFGMAGE